MFADFKQFVPSDYCFQCKGCCVFESSVTPWRPLLAQEEKLRSCLHDTEACFDNETVEPDGYVKTIAEEEKGRCSVFTEKFLCRYYETRPFECRLYPFVVVEKDRKSYLAAHKSCPFVLDHLRDEVFEDYTNYLIGKFQTPEYRLFLNRNPCISRDYGKDNDDVEIVYELDDSDEIAHSASLAQWQKNLSHKIFNAELRLSAYAFPALAVWESFFGFDIKEINGAACVFATDRVGTFLYLMPLGGDNMLSTAEQAFRIMNRINLNPKISRIENVPDQFVGMFPDTEYRCVYKTDEFVYHRENIARLSGNAYKSKRSDYNHFVKHNQHEFVPYNTAMAEECMGLFERWVCQKAEADDLACQMIKDARESHRMMFYNHDRLGMMARVVKVDGRIVAYTFGYPLTRRDFCVFAEITDRAFKGLPSFIFSEFCGDPEVVPFERVNVMDAFALPKLEQTKYSFRPIETLPVYTVYKN